MFTGIVEELGTVVSRTGARLRLAADVALEDVKLGDSIAVSGCCLTVVDFGDGWWEADVSDETDSRTTTGGLQPGDAVNLERPVRLMDRLGGHLVQGHVDAVGVVVRPVPDLAIEIPESLCRYVVEKGSIAFDGVSLTVVSLEGTLVSMAIIAHTAEVTTLGRRRPGDQVNVEVDVMAKYAEQLLKGFER
jgi:riboflavin synthase